uniref:Uncharacterized protein n=1 Tax=Xiphophorus maculatus TaxID=8083 RepID=A0A3B5R2L0_XIPMA
MWTYRSYRYGLLRLINITYQLANGTMEELTELRNMVMQNRVILDFLTAPQGGVCKIIGPTCCTFSKNLLHQTLTEKIMRLYAHSKLCVWYLFSKGNIELA